MTIPDRGVPKASEHARDDQTLVVPLSRVDRTWLPVVGGKAANLGELIRAGFTVPEGFCVTTAAYALLSASAGLEAWLPALATSRAEDATWRTELAAGVFVFMV